MQNSEPGNYSPRNFRLGVINGILYMMADTLFDPTLVLVAFLSNLTASPLLLGAVLPLRDGGWSLPQLWISGYLQSKPEKLPLYNKMTVVRMVIWGLLFVSITFVREPNWSILLFFLLYGIGSAASGVGGMAFLEVVGRTIKPRRRGEFYAWRLGGAGILGIGASLLVRYLLDPQSQIHFPYNFSILSGLYFLFASVGVMVFSFVKEGHDYPVIPKATTRDQIKRFLDVLRTNQHFRYYLTMQSMLIVANAATPFFAVYVIQVLGGPKAMIGVYLAAATIASLLANLILGRISLAYGNRRVMSFASLTGLVMSATVLLLVIIAPILQISPLNAGLWLVPVFIFSGIRTTGIGISGNSLLLDLSPHDERTLYIGFTNTFLGIILLLTALSGLVYANFGFLALLVLTGIAHLIALITARKMHRPAG